MARVLVVDDEEGVRSFIAEALEIDGHSVSRASDGEEGIATLKRQSFHLVVTDLRMPRVGGMEVVRFVRAEQSDVEVIVLTAHASVDSAIEAMKLGAFDYLQKPISGPAELRMLVRRALERRDLVALRDRERDPSLVQLGYGSAAMAKAEDALKKVARTSATVLLTGESGTGKEIAARSVHAWSGRADAPFVAVNCAALPEHLIESELFGHERGAFTGATGRRRGRVELADGGTFFLDEIAELKPDVQVKLLRLLQERCFERLGGDQTVEVDVRWIAATNRDLRAEMEAGRFREDLYHRLAVFPVELPPLRERREDIAPLADALLVRIGADLGRTDLTLGDEARDQLSQAAWSGNVRELANTLERAAILSDDGRITTDHLIIEPPRATQDELPESLADLEQMAIRQALADFDGNRRRAAERLGIGLRTLYDKLKRYEIEA